MLQTLPLASCKSEVDMILIESRAARKDIDVMRNK
jgi:hypothetical protein